MDKDSMIDQFFPLEVDRNGIEKRKTQDFKLHITEDSSSSLSRNASQADCKFKSPKSTVFRNDYHHHESLSTTPHRNSQQFFGGISQVMTNNRGSSREAQKAQSLTNL